MSEFYHLGFADDVLTKENCHTCLLSGDPDRTHFIAKNFLTKSIPLSNKRGLISYLGILDNGKPILLATSGIGGASTSIVVNELAQAGIDTVVRLGTTGAIQDYIPIGSAIISKAALCRQGAANDVAPVEYPASSDPFLTVKLHENLKKTNLNVYCGITASVDTFYEGQERYHGKNIFLLRKHSGMIEEYKHLNVLNFEMESGTLFKSANVYGLKAACVCIAVSNRSFSESIVLDQLENNLRECTLAIFETLS